MEELTINITDISDLLGKGLPPHKPVFLGDFQVDSKVSSLLSAMKTQAKHAYVLSWEGSKIPRGAVINGETIAWTQHGCVTSESGKMIGTYDRVVEFGGQSGNEQVMIVYSNK